MPKYTFECKKCGHQFPVFRDADGIERSRKKCPGCGSKTARRVFVMPHNVIPDNFENPVPMTTLKPVYGDDRRRVEYAHSRTEFKRMMELHDRKYGTKLEHAR